MKRDRSCERCGRCANIQEHHPLPRRFYGKGNKNPWTEELCDSCHKVADEITFAIDKKLFADAREIYTAAFKQFMDKKTVRPPNPHIKLV